jgi:hypothetical protein
MTVTGVCPARGPEGHGDGGGRAISGAAAAPGMHVDELVAAADAAAAAAPPLRRRYWLQLRDAAGALRDRLRQPRRLEVVDTDRARLEAERRVRVCATLCLAACRHEVAALAPAERVVLRLLCPAPRAPPPISGARAPA